jgi:hypothetical protein
MAGTTNELRNLTRAQMRAKKCDSALFAMVPFDLLSKVSHLAIAVWVALADYLNEEDTVWPSHTSLATAARCSVPSVKRAIKELQASGRLDVRPRFRENGTPDTNHYFMRFAPLEPNVVNPSPCSPVNLSNGSPVNGSGFTPDLRSITSEVKKDIPTGSNEKAVSTSPALPLKDTPKPKKPNWAGVQFFNLKTICPNIDAPAGCKMLNGLAKQYGGQSIVEEALVRMSSKGAIMPSVIWGALHNTCKAVVAERGTIKPTGRAEPSAGNSRRTQ